YVGNRRAWNGVGQLAGRTFGTSERVHHRTCRLAGNEIQRTRRGRSIRGAPGVIAHGESLRPIPHGGDGIAVEIAHDGGTVSGATCAVLEVLLREVVHETVVRGQL